MKSAATMLLSAAAATIAVIMLSGTCVVGVQAKKDLGTCSSSSECSSGYCAGGFCCDSDSGPNCDECYSEQYGACMTCSPGYRRTYLNTCVEESLLKDVGTCSDDSECTSGYCAGGFCCYSMTGPNCDECYGEYDGDCKTCSPGYRLTDSYTCVEASVQDEGICSDDSECSSGYCAGGFCCHSTTGPNCDECFGENDGDCKLCSPGYTLTDSYICVVTSVQDVGTCSDDSECSSGYCAGGFCCYSTTGPNCDECYGENDGDCRTCSPGYTRTESYTCEESLLKDLGTCSDDSECTSGYCAGGFCCYSSTGPNCAECYNEIDGDCRTCSPGYRLTESYTCEESLLKDLGTCSSNSECSSGYCAGGFCCYSSTGPNCAECYNENDGDCRTCSPGYSEPTKDNGYTCEELEADACAAFSSSKAKCKKSAKKGLACSYSSRKGCVCARSMSVRTDAASLCVVCIAL